MQFLWHHFEVPSTTVRGNSYPKTDSDLEMITIIALLFGISAISNAGIVGLTAFICMLIPQIGIFAVLETVLVIV